MPTKPIIKIIGETPDYLVLEKPSGILVHPTAAQEKNTLTAWLTKQYPEISSVGDDPKGRPGIVHRLDKDASGLIVAAKTQKSFMHLKKQFQDRRVDKEYLALVHGQPGENHGVIDLPIARSKDGKMSGVRDAASTRTLREAKTEWRVEKKFAHAALLRVKIYTGRTHQIRAHLKAIGHPIVGDPLYRARMRWRKTLPLPPRLFLHAAHLAFYDLQNQHCEFDSPLPPELSNYLNKLL